MILIADSGSSKTDWAFISDDKKQIFSTTGLNPQIQDEQEIIKMMQRELLPLIKGLRIEKVFFYGAGCSGSDNNKKIQYAINHFLPQTPININSDLLAAARAIFGNEKGIACIMGTGSNSGIYDGKDIVNKIPALGYILGDEGSGTDIGIRILRDYFYEKCPSEVAWMIKDFLKMGKSEILDQIYRSHRANSFLASLASLASANNKMEYFHNLISSAFDSFFKNRLLPYPNACLYSIGFIGSLAYLNSSVLSSLAIKYGFSEPVMIKSPINKLIEYHLILLRHKES